MLTLKEYANSGKKKKKNLDSALEELVGLPIPPSHYTPHPPPPQRDRASHPTYPPVSLPLTPFCFFSGLHPLHMGLNQSQPTPQPQQCQIRATSATNTTAPSNARSFPHQARPGIEPASSWILVRFFPTQPQRARLPLTSLIAKATGHHGPPVT